ncbi:MAG: endolytic transglycosylase MltG, partial [Armatimonadetes bacterium]|nr:endolytic transglycosylase MltG [Armatimonadota bacterium]
LLDKLVSGKVATRRVTFPEGYALAAMAQRCEQAGIGPAAEYRRLATAAAASFGVKDLPAGASLEGYLFPATYHLPLDAGPRELIEAQVAAFVKAWRQASAGVQPRRPRHELVTMASLIEREVRVADERARVAGVIANRLAKNMRLEIDATVIYALGEHRTRVLYRDLEVDSPYNTYRRKGLPPGPIANPGEASLTAALRPEQHAYLYYVLTAGGRHLFSRTWAEHLRAKAVGERMRRSP